MLLAPDQKLKISSRTDSIILVERMIEDVCDVFTIGEEKFGNILISVTEAVNNAILHGNKNNPEKTVDISFRSNPEKITFIVRDQGNGFDATKIPDPTAPENLEKETGRGIYLMQHLADKVEYDDNGRAVVLTFNIN